MRDHWMKHRKRILIVLLVAAVLIGALFWGGVYPKPDGSAMSGTSELTASQTTEPADSAAPTAGAATESAPSGDPAAATHTDAPIADKTAASETAAGTDPAEDMPIPGGAGSSGAVGITTDPQTGHGDRETDPMPAGRPLPMEPQDAAVTDEQATCTFSVSCETGLDQMDLLEEDKWELIPADGVILAAKTVTFYKGESVFHVLQREMKKAGIQMEFSNTPMYHSAYIAGIGNLYEFDAGELSGWVYEVNGWFPNYGCSRYQLQDGDVVQWHYTCDLGEDVGGNNATGS